MRTAGEIEARDARERLYWDDDTRRAILPKTLVERTGVLFAEDAPNRGVADGVEESLAGGIRYSVKEQTGTRFVDFSSNSLNNDSENGIMKADDGLESLDDMIAALPVKKTGMKTFPPYNKSRSDASERATRWAHREDVVTGARTTVSYHGKWYIIEKFDSMELGYSIVCAVDNRAITKFVNEVKKRGRNTNNQRVSGSSNRFIGIDAKRNTAGGDGRRVSYDAAQHGGENGGIQQLGTNQNRERRIQGNATTSDEYGGTNRQELPGVDVAPINSDSDRVKYSVTRKSMDEEADIFDEEFIQPMWLPKWEYAMVSRAIMEKNAGIEDGDLQSVDYVYAADEFYVYSNNSLGDFTIVKKFSTTQDIEEINYAREMIDNGAYAGRQRFDQWAAGVRGRRGSDIRNSRRIENAGTQRTDDRFYAQQSGSDAVGYSSGVGKDNAFEEMKRAVARKSRAQAAVDGRREDSLYNGQLKENSIKFSEKIVNRDSTRGLMGISDAGADYVTKALPDGSMKNEFHDSLVSREWALYYETVNKFDWDRELRTKEFVFAVKLGDKTVLSTYQRGKPTVFFITKETNDLEEGVLYGRRERRVLELVGKDEIRRNEKSGTGVDTTGKGSDENVREIAGNSSEGRDGRGVFDGGEEVLHAEGSPDITEVENAKKYSVARKPMDEETDIFDEEFFQPMWLPEREYAMVSHAIMEKNAGVEDGELQSVDYVYAVDEFYVYTNNSLGDFTVIEKIDPEEDRERINVLRRMLDDGIYTYADRERLNGLLDDVRSRKRSDNRDYGRFENRSTATKDDGVFGRQSSSDAVGYSSGAGKDNTFEEMKRSVARKSRAQAAEEAMERYRESGDTKDLPLMSWTKDFERSAKNRAQYLAGQVQGAEYDLAYNVKTAEERERVDALLSSLREKQKKALENLGVAEEIRAVSDAAGINRNLRLAEIVDELHDADTNKLKNGNYRFNDVYRNFKRVFGKHYENYAKPLLDAFDAAKGDWARDMIARYVDLRKAVVKDFEIKKGSRESKAVQWIGEGERNIDWKRDREFLKTIGITKKGELKPGMRLRYSEAMLEAEFGKERAAQIKQAAEWFREQYDELINEINRVRGQIYVGQSDKLIPKRKDYFRHFREISEGLSGLKTIFHLDNNISPELVGVSEYTQPKTKWASIVQHRDGKVTDEGALEGFLDYLPQAMRAIYIDPYIEQFRGFARDLAELKSDVKDTSLNGFIKYLGDYSASLAGKSSIGDRAILDWLGSNGRTVIRALNQFNNRTKANAVLGNLGSVTKQVMNLPNGIMLLDNPANMLGGVMDTASGCELFGLRRGNQIHERYSHSDFLTERLDVEKAARKFEKNGVGKGLSILLGAADEFGARSIWNAAYREGLNLEMKKSGVESVSATDEQIRAAAKYADELTRSAVAGRGIGEIPLAYQSQLGKLVLPFQIEVSNTWNVQRDIMSGRRKTGKLEHSAARAWRLALGFLAVWGLGVALEELTGTKGSFDPLGDIYDGVMQGIEETEGEGTLAAALQGSLRAAQNLGGDFIGSRPFGWLAGELLSAIDEDWDENFFNGNGYTSQGVNIPAVQSLTKGIRKYGDGDWLGGTTELASSFLMPYGGKQLEKGIRGVGDVLRGGSYQNNIFKELATGERGEQYYEMEQSPENYVKAAVFGASSLSENKKYWKGRRLEQVKQEKARRLLSEKERAFRGEYDKAHAGGEVRKLYRERKDYDVYPYEEVKAERKFSYNGQEISVTLSDAQVKEYQQYQNALMQEKYEEVFATDEYKVADTDRKLELLKDARSVAKRKVSKRIKEDYQRLNHLD